MTDDLTAAAWDHYLTVTTLDGQEHTLRAATTVAMVEQRPKPNSTYGMYPHHGRELLNKVLAQPVWSTRDGWVVTRHIVSAHGGEVRAKTPDIREENAAKDHGTTEHWMDDPNEDDLRI